MASPRRRQDLQGRPVTPREATLPSPRTRSPARGLLICLVGRHGAAVEPFGLSCCERDLVRETADCLSSI